MERTFETRSDEHIATFTHQLREAFTEYASEVSLTGDKLAKLLVDKGVTHMVEDHEVTDEVCEFMLENADQLGLGDCLVLLEALGAEVNVTIMLPVESQKKLLTPRKQHRLQAANHLDGVQRKLQRRNN